MTDEKMEELWKILSSATRIHLQDYDEAVTIGSVFGQMKKEIQDLMNEVDMYKTINNNLRKALIGRKLSWKGGVQYLSSVNHSTLGKVRVFQRVGLPKETNIYFTLPFVDDEGDISCYMYDYEAKEWATLPIYLGVYLGEDSIEIPDGGENE